MTPRGAFIAVEGVDGSGKSGVVRAIVAALQAAGHDVVATREPGGTPQGEALRGLLLAGDDAAWEPRAELLLMTAARVQHAAHVIRPGVAAGRIVVSDRYAGSTLAYQGAGRGMDEALIRGLEYTRAKETRYAYPVGPPYSDPIACIEMLTVPTPLTILTGRRGPVSPSRQHKKVELQHYAAGTVHIH